MDLNEKKQIVEDLHERLKKAAIVILTDYKGLNVESVTKLRQQLREAGVEFKVVKNTFLRRASENTNAAAISEYYTGPTAIAFSYKDPVAPAKVLTKFAETNDKLKIRVAALDGRILNFEDIKALSLLPSREALLSQVLSAMQAVPTSFVNVLSAVPRSLVQVVQAIKDKKEASA